MVGRPATLTATTRPFAFALALVGALLLTSLALPSIRAGAQDGGEEGQPPQCVPSDADPCAGASDDGEPGGGEPDESVVPEESGEPELVRGDDGCWVDVATGEVASCEDEIEDTLVLAEDGCWYHPDGVLAYCDAVEEPPDSGLIPGVDGCLYYPEGGLAECPEGVTPIDGGCTPMADGSDGCVIPGPVAGESAVPTGGDEPETVLDEPEPVLDEPSGSAPQLTDQTQSNALGAQPGAGAEQVNAASPFDPVSAAARLRQVVAPFGSWLAALLLWLLGMA